MIIASPGRHWQRQAAAVVGRGGSANLGPCRVARAAGVTVRCPSGRSRKLDAATPSAVVVSMPVASFASRWRPMRRT
jgi:hypothetical protein